MELHRHFIRGLSKLWSIHSWGTLTTEGHGKERVTSGVQNKDYVPIFVGQRLLVLNQTLRERRLPAVTPGEDSVAPSLIGRCYECNG